MSAFHGTGGLNDTQAMLVDVATSARSFLLPHWYRWHRAWGPPFPSAPSRWTCVRSSLFLLNVLRQCGVTATIQSGQARETSPGSVGEDCGLLTPIGWAGHAWVEADRFVVDITADQFGQPPVVITSSDDPAYRPARDPANRLAPTASGIAAVAEIWPL